MKLATINRFCLCTYLMMCATAAHASSITWTASSPNSDMNTPTNWNPNTVPGSNDDAIFDSSLNRIDTNPTATSIPFSVSTFNFPHQAFPFSFHFNNTSLAFNGAGITGNHTNCTIYVTNTDNDSFPGNLLSFLGSFGSSGTSSISISNSATLSGNHSNTGFGSINSNLYSNGPFSIATGGTLTATNTGNDSTDGTGNNGVSNTGSSQLQFNQSFTAGNNVAVSVSNSGTFSGNNTTQGDAVAIVNGSQFLSSGAFQVGDNFSCDVQNTGQDSSSGVGLSNIGQINATQMMLLSTGTVGNHCTITVSNTATNSSQTTSFPDFVGYLNDQQFFVGSIFQAGDDFSLTVSNTGTDTSSGHGGGQIAAINSNSGTTGNQILLNHGATLGDHASISAANNGTYSGTNTNNGSSVGLMNLGQIAIGDANAPGSYTFTAGDDFNLSAASTGNDSTHGTGFDIVGTVSTDQVVFYTPCSLGNNAKLTLTKTGDFSGQTSTSYVNVGSCGGSQLNCQSTFQAGDNFTVVASNSGTHTGSGIGDDFIGDLITGQQMGFWHGLVVENNASFNISNSGTNSSNSSSGNQVGSLMGYGKQFLVKETFQAGDNLNVVIANTGFDDSTGRGGNYVGFINNNTADQTASQLHLDAGGIVGNGASISLSNTGTYQGNNTNGNIIGILSGQQFHSVEDFHAGNDFSLTASNLGRSNASGQNSHSIGQVGNNAQIAFGAVCALGNNASIILTNSGINNDATGTSNTIGYVGGSQMAVAGNFSAGTNLSMQASNTAANSGDSSNFVGYAGSQFLFEQGCTLNDGSLISAFNSGTIINSQIVFNEGFTIVSGKATIQALNEGSIGSFGIDIEGSNAGGNAEILLKNSSLNIGTTLPTFTIGSLSGDSTSLVQSQPTLIINTDALTQTEFAGIIQDFPSTASALTKTGTGTQKLSGANTYTGLTTIEEGTLIVKGSLASDVLISSVGMLKGSGTIGGTLTNAGTISPGESIGTMTVLSNYIENNGTYHVEVNGAGASDLLNISGTATLDGGIVLVTSDDGTFRFQQPYTIVNATGGVDGTYARATSPAFIIPTLTYDPNHVYLTLQSALVNAAESCNQYGVARNLDHIINPDAAQSLLISAIANLPQEEAGTALESLSGFQYTQDVWATEISLHRFLRRLYNPLRSLVSPCDCCSSSHEATAWLQTGDGLINLHGKQGHRTQAYNYEVTGGIQKSLCHDLTFGLAGSYEYDHAKYKNGKEKRHSEFVAAYGLYRPCLFYGLFDIVYGHGSHALHRTIHAANLRYHAKGNPKLNTFAFYGEAGFDFDRGAHYCLIQPFIGIQIGKNGRSQIKENKADGWGLKINKYDWTSTSSRLGLHLTACDFCNCVDAALDIAWNELWSSHHNSTSGRFRQFGNTFRICGNRLDKRSLDYALSFTTCFCEGVNGYLELAGEWWEHANTLDIVGGIEFHW